MSKKIDPISYLETFFATQHADACKMFADRCASLWRAKRPKEKAATRTRTKKEEKSEAESLVSALKTRKQTDPGAPDVIAIGGK